uniref:Orc1-like AAA ATPase domain-containing protein n=1 Tax=Odontella aurita TaxID=265563 RepID=A0A7S4K6S9_9STRA|mmetsp:Transcript_62389/g.184606  ORF Transcript_62389/g.184606 Transcript_62389/m.184606 type:complete len:691 (+) Transcript_62389:1396-3468(+)
MRQLQPISAVVSALDEYCNLLAANTGRIDRVRKDLSAALGNEVGVLVKLVPSLGRLVSVTKKDAHFLQASGPQALQRVVFLLQKMIRVSCSKAEPIVLFLDNLEYADKVSLTLMRGLVTHSQVHGLLFIGCYRSNEVAEDHPFVLWKEKIQRSLSTSVTSIDVANMDTDSVNCLVSDMLGLMPRRTLSLGEAVLYKTSGNPLFISQLLISLRDSGLIRYSLPSRRWVWDIGSIREMDIAADVVDLMTAKLLSFPPEVRSALRVVSAFGNQCKKGVIDILNRDVRAFKSIIALLDLAVSEGLLSDVGEGAAYRFSHDEIRNAAYMLIAETDRAAFRLEIGRSLWRSSSGEGMTTNIFIVVDQLLRGSRLIFDHHERINVAQLSLEAGHAACSMSAFLPASSYYKSGVGLIFDSDWDQHRELCLDLYNSCAEVECILGDFEMSITHLECALEKATTIGERLRSYFTLSRTTGLNGDLSNAIDTATTALRHLGVTFPSEINQRVVIEELTATRILLGASSEDELQSMKGMNDADKKEALRFISLIALFAYKKKREIFALASIQMVQLSLSHGVSEFSACGFASFGMLLCMLMEEFADARKCAKLAISILSRFPGVNGDITVNVIGATHGFCFNWTEPLQSSVPPLKQAIERTGYWRHTSRNDDCSFLHWNSFVVRAPTRFLEGGNDIILKADD